MSKIRLLLWFLNVTLLVLLGPIYSHAQGTVMIKGRVADAKDNKPLPGATIQLVKGKVSTETDEDGKFSISVPLNSLLSITNVGFKTIRVKVTGPVLGIALERASSDLDDVVVVGYGTEKKELLTGAVATVKFKEADVEVPTIMTGNLLAGRVAGLDVGNNNGLSGQSAPNIIIRTNNSWNAQPVLYVIDGKISTSADFNNLSPVEIDNVSVLKDAATAAVYGSRAAGGVIVVTTKKGKTGRPVINYSFNTGVDTRTKGIPLTSAVQTGELYNTLDGSNIPGSWTQSDLTYYKTHNFGGGLGYGYNLLKDVWRNPYTLSHNLSISGGSDKVRYFVGGSYVHQDGFLNNIGYAKYNLRANITADLTKNFQIFTGIGLNSTQTENSTALGSANTSDTYRKLLVWQPQYPVWTTGAHPGLPVSYGWIGNMGAEVNGMGGNINYNYLRPVITLSGTYKVPFIQGLSATGSFIKSYTQNVQHYFFKQYQMAVVQQVTPNQWNTDSITGYIASSQVNPSQISDIVTWSEDKQLNFQLNYDKTFGEHHIKGWLIYERYQQGGSGLQATIKGFPVFLTDQWWAANTQSVNQYVSNSTNYSTFVNGRKSWAGQFFYDYKEKYLATFAYRYDGSSNFAPNERWGFFPSGSLGWIVSKENFFGKVKGIDFLKLRATVGLIGNDAVGGWQWQQSYQTGNSAFFGAKPFTNPGITYGSVINPNLTWEKTLNKNIGIDITFLKHYNVSIDGWHSYTYDILGARIQTIPATFSRSLPAVNYGEEKAQGLDFSLGYTNRIGNVIINTNVTASYGYAWYTKMDQNVTYDWQNLLGSSGGRHASYIPGYTVTGMLRTQADLNNLTSANAKYNFYGTTPGLGQLVYKDVSGPGGKPDGVIDDNDLSVLKKDNNPIVVGWHLEAEWKGFSLAATFNGYFKEWTDISPVVGGVEWNRNWNQWATNSWSPTNTDAQNEKVALPYKFSVNDPNQQVTYPYREYVTTNLNYTSNGAVSSTFWLKNSSFVRLRNLTLAYTIPRSLYQKYGFDNIHLFVTGTNLFIISSFNHRYFDPETAKIGVYSDGTDYPIMRSFDAGVSITF